MAAQVIQGVSGLAELVGGTHLGYSDYLEITQERVNTFADATGDHQWIHVDPVRAKAESPFGGAIAHGYLTLSLGPVLAPEVFAVEGFNMALNYGLGKVRFPAPVPVGSRLRLGVQLDRFELLGEGDPSTYGVQVYMTFVFEVEGAAKPSCVAEVIFRYLQ